MTHASGHTSAAVVAILGLALALLVAWVLPVAAIAVVWPLLFVVPGLGIVAAVRPPIGATGRLGLAIVLSVAVSTHLVYWLSLLTGGYERWTIFLAAAILAVPLPLVAWRHGAAALTCWAPPAWQALRRNRAGFALALLAATFVGLVLDSGLWKATETGIASGGSNWSDLGVHLSIAQSLNAANFPPEVPYFAGAPLVYHWFADFHSAITARAADMFAVPAFIVSSAVMAGALALLVHGLARTILTGPAARRAAILAAVLVVFGGGMGWIRFIGDLNAGYGDPISLIREQTYDNFWFQIASADGQGGFTQGPPTWPYFRIPSVMGTGLLVHRATAFGLPILVGAILLLVAGLPGAARRVRGWRDRPLLIGLAGVLGALLAPFHFFFFPAFLAIALAYVLAGRRLVDRDAPRNAALLLGPMVLAIPFALGALGNAGGSGALQPVLGWESAPLEDGPAAVAFFYVTNLGLPLLLAVGALLAPGTPQRLFLGAWALVMFAIPNLVEVSAIAFDMNKYFQAMWIAVAMLAAWWIRRWPWPAIGLVLLLAVPSPLLVAGWTAMNRAQVLDWGEADAAEWIAANTPEEAVFATDGWLNSPTDAAGRRRLLTFAPYVANLGYAPQVRVRQVHDMFCAGDPQHTAALLRELDADYLLETGSPADCADPTDFAAADALTLVFANDTVRIWQLTDAAGAASG